MFPTPDEAENAFYEAMRQADVTLMMQVWGDEDEVVCIHPGGLRTIGLPAVRGAWEQIFSHGPIAAFPAQVNTITSLMHAVHILIEQIMVDTPHGKDTLNFYTTNVYQKGPQGWRLIVHHASTAPQEAALMDVPNASRSVH